MDTDLQTLNEQFAIPGHVSFQAGSGDLAMAVVDNQYAHGSMTLAGGHVMHYLPHHGRPVLWVSPNTAHIIGKAMRGGVPVCWPWFGPHPTDPEHQPLHGLVRTMLWSVSGTRALPDGSTEISMTVCDTPETLAAWPHRFRLELTATFGPRLRLELRATNPGNTPYQYTAALHPYYPVSDIHAITLHGLEGVDYLDKTEDYARKTQVGPLRFTGWTDRIYLNTAADIRIEDWGHTINIAKQGSRTTVVWNPAEKDAEMPDVGAGQHRYFVCAEAANAADDIVTVAPGGEGRLVMEIWTNQGWRGAL